MTGQIHFDSHVWIVTDVACALVNDLTAGEDGGRPVEVPAPRARAAAVARILGRPGYAPVVRDAEAEEFVALAARLRRVFEAAAEADLDTAVRTVNAMLAETGAHPRLDRAAGGGWTLHFHGASDDLVPGWGAGIASGLALAIGSNLAGRLGVCAAPGCDRVFVDTSRNGTRRFCSARCQSRVKAAAHRARGRGD